MNYLLIGFFGALGALSRYNLGIYTAHAGPQGFPWGTLAANIAGCFLLGLITRTIKRIPAVPAPLANGLGTGFVGAFTTFSAFSVESGSMLLEGNYTDAFIYIFVSMIAGIAAVILGMAAGNGVYKWLDKRRVMRVVRIMYKRASAEGDNL